MFESCRGRKRFLQGPTPCGPPGSGADGESSRSGDGADNSISWCRSTRMRSYLSSARFPTPCSSRQLTDGSSPRTATLCALTGYSSEELRDASLEMLVPNRMRARHVALRSAYSSEGGTRSLSDRTDIVLLRADGNEVPVDVALCSIPQGDDTVVVATVRDASKQRLADQVAERERGSSTRRTTCRPHSSTRAMSTTRCVS